MYVYTNIIYEYNNYIIDKSEPPKATVPAQSANMKSYFKVDELKKIEDANSKKISQTKKMVSAFVANDWTFALVENQELRDYLIELNPKAF